jgi:hypothetical protein
MMTTGPGLPTGAMAGHMHGATMVHEEADTREGLAVNLLVAPSSLFVGETTKLNFFVNQKPGDVPIVINTLDVEHEKLMHVIGIRDDMNEFFHIHPVASGAPGVMSVDHVFSKPGKYKIWSEVKKDGVNHSFGHAPVEIGGSGPRSEKKVDLTETASAGDYSLALLHDTFFAKNTPVVISFNVHNFTGQDAPLENYLGTQMHLSIIKDDWSEFIHTHPMAAVPSGKSFALINEVSAHGGPGLSFQVTFPQAGLYKMFAQFRPQGSTLPPDEALTASFWVEVKDQPALAVSPWWILLISSLILIGLLSKAVQKYLAVSE